MNKTTTELGKEVLNNAAPTDTSQYLIYMLILFMCLLMVAGLVAFWLWLKYQKTTKPVTPSAPEPSAGNLRDIEQNILLTQHTQEMMDIRKETSNNARSVGKISEAVDQLVQVTEAQGNRMLQHDSILQQLYTVVEKQNKIIGRFHDEAG